MISLASQINKTEETFHPTKQGVYGLLNPQILGKRNECCKMPPSRVSNAVVSRDIGFAKVRNYQDRFCCRVEGLRDMGVDHNRTTTQNSKLPVEAEPHHLYRKQADGSSCIDRPYLRHRGCPRRSVWWSVMRCMPLIAGSLTSPRVIKPISLMTPCT